MADESIIKAFDGKNIRIVWNEQEEKYFFSVVDVVQVLTDSSNPTDYLKKLRKRDTELGVFLGTNCPQIQMMTPTGKKRLTLAADLEGIFRIIQSIPSKKAEPVKRWLAEAATTEISRNQNPQTMEQNKRVAQSGGKAAKAARSEVEKQIGHSIISSLKASDYIRPIEDTEAKELPTDDNQQ